MTTLSRSNPAVRAALRASFPDYSGRKLRLEAYSGPRSFDLYWSGGTRDQLVLLDASRGAAALRVLGAPWSNRAAFEPIDQPAGTILAVRSWFCGKDAGVAFYVRQPESGELAAPAVALIGSGL